MGEERTEKDVGKKDNLRDFVVFELFSIWIVVVSTQTYRGDKTVWNLIHTKN